MARALTERERGHGRHGPARWRSKRSRRDTVGCAASGRPRMIRGHRARWLREVSTIAAYRDRWHITGTRTLGGRDEVKCIEQIREVQRAAAAAKHAREITQEVLTKQMSTSRDLEVQPVLRIDL